MIRNYIPQLLLIAGNGRNSGKTTLACRLISKFCGQVPIVAVKISPHAHNGVRNFTIFEETDKSSGKDSARMLEAGATRAVYVTCSDEDIEAVVPEIKHLADQQSFIICESGGLRKAVEPGLFIIVNAAENREIKQSLTPLIDFNHVWMTFDGKNYEPEADKIIIENDKWKMRM
jgi:Ni2+-binding GTPase involved in maturation of urease and hydrogenase